MNNINEKTAIISIKSKCSEDGKYRYTLTRTWDDSNKKAVVIGINPSRATHLKGDNTSTNAMNYLIDNDFGEMTIVNLFPYRCVKPNDLKNRDKKYDVNNLNYIDEACKYADMILIAWGYENKYKTEKTKVLQKLKKYDEKIMCFKDCNGNKPQHLRILSDSWTLVNYF